MRLLGVGLAAIALFSFAGSLNVCPSSGSIATQSETIAMQPTLIQWQWPAGRRPEQKMIVRIASMKSESGGLFGIRKSPSIGENFPDAMLLEAEVVEGPPNFKGETLRIRAPKLELGGADAGTYAAVGLIGKDAGKENILICFKRVPQSVEPDELKSWLEAWDCS